MKEIQQNIESYTNKNYSIYRKDNELLMQYYSERIIEILQKNGKQINQLQVLDLGLGHRLTTPFFEKYFSDYTVLEGDGELIKKYEQENPQHSVKLVETFFEDYEDEKKYDVIILGFVCEHVDDPKWLIKKFKGFLKEDGYMFLTVPNAESLNRRIGNMAGLLPNIYELSEHDIAVGHKRYYTVTSFQTDCIQAGLNPIQIEGIFLKPITTKQFLQLELSQNIMNAFVKMGQNYPELSVALFAIYHKAM